MVKLLTLGSLSAVGGSFGREKPLLLLAYLALNGPQLRRDVARRFWPDASNPMNSLSVALGQLKKAVPEAVQAGETQISTPIWCDALEFRQVAQAGDLTAARELYRGAFLVDLTLDELGEELEEWVMQTREALAQTMRELLLQAAKTQLATDPARAVTFAAEAYAVAGAAPLAPARLRELHSLLGAAGHPMAAQLMQEAAELGLHLHPAPLPLPAAPLLGRSTELRRLQDLQPGETLWLRGAAGLGKTALLRAAQGGMNAVLLSGRSGHAFQTLLPLVQEYAFEPSPTTEAAWLEFLMGQPTPLLLDDWEAADPETRRVLLALARSHAGGPLSVASREKPPAAWPELVLRPLAADHLTSGQLDRSAGIPALLAAQTPPELADAYANLLAPHTPRARQLLACLAVQSSGVQKLAQEDSAKSLSIVHSSWPIASQAGVNRQATCAALDLSADQMAELLEGLGRACLLSGTRPLAWPALRAWLDTWPSLETEVLTLLAPHLPVADALPLYLRAHELTGSSDFVGFQEALEQHVRTLLEAGRDNEAEGLLAKHAQNETNRLLRGRALDALGRYPEAIKLLDKLERTPLVEAYRGRVLFRLGQPAGAEQAAQQALGGDLEAKAQGHNLLGALALAGREFKAAQEHYERAAGLFFVLGDANGHINALCTQAIALTQAGASSDNKPDNKRADLLVEILDKSKEATNPQTLLNLGWLLEHQDNAEAALEFNHRAAAISQELEKNSTSARAWNNIGALYQRQGRLAQAEDAYKKAIHYSRITQDRRFLALALGNLAELQKSLPLIEEALLLLRGAEQSDLVAYFEELRVSFMGRSGAE